MLENPLHIFTFGTEIEHILEADFMDMFGSQFSVCVACTIGKFISRGLYMISKKQGPKYIISENKITYPNIHTQVITNTSIKRPRSGLSRGKQKQSLEGRGGVIDTAIKQAIKYKMGR